MRDYRDDPLGRVPAIPSAPADTDYRAAFWPYSRPTEEPPRPDVIQWSEHAWGNDIDFDAFRRRWALDRGEPIR